MFSNAVLLNQMIANQQRAIRYYVFFAVALVGLGVIVIVAAYLLSSSIVPDAFKGLLQIGGVFVSSLSAFQIKEILNRKEKIGIFETIQLRLQELERTPDSAETTVRKQIDDLLWKVIEKTAVG